MKDSLEKYELLKSPAVLFSVGQRPGDNVVCGEYRNIYALDFWSTFEKLLGAEMYSKRSSIVKIDKKSAEVKSA